MGGNLSEWAKDAAVAAWIWALRPWRRVQRRIDLQILWPTVCEQANDSDEARVVFRLHMEVDPAYSDMTTEERNAYVEALRPV